MGTVDKFRARAGDTDPIEWLKQYVKDLNEQNKEETLPVIIQKNPNKIIEKNVQTSFNVGYLFLQDISEAFHPIEVSFLLCKAFCIFQRPY